MGVVTLWIIFEEGKIISMKVLFIPDIAEYGGSFNSFCEMVYTLSEKYDVTPVIVCSKKGKYTEFAKKNNFEVYFVGYEAFYVGKGSSHIRKIIKKILFPCLKIRYKLSEESALKKIRKKINMSEIDIIHTNINRNSFGAKIADYYKIPHVWHIREFGELDYECVSLLKNYIQYMNKHCDRFIAISHAVEKYWIAKGIDANKIETIYNGIDTKKFGVKGKRYHADNSMIRIIMAGEVMPTKGQSVLLEALTLLSMEERKKIKVDIYGTGNRQYIKKLQKYVTNHGLDRIVDFKGFSNELNLIISDYDIGVMGSVSEGFGRITIEYMISGLCVFASNGGANMELIDNGHNGYLYETENSVSLAALIRKAIEQPECIIEIKENAIDYAKNNFSKEINAKKIYKVYNYCMDEEKSFA